ncbi:Glycosidase [Pseudarcicella hirudinis]|uniref:Glycosidase n=1 Tax=Pseudarcicella hirudinis TaxID=1079859 RepID=A0A1I5UY35_9BACT|nr:glycoside hydrolase family 13 protein [Pseudarcicella hirudinis]SFQ00130.1 Glycosidase [Pseudarcicella hirudinis]
MKKIINFIGFGLLFFALISGETRAQSIQKVEPVNWWTGMKNPKLQLLVYGKDISAFEVSANYPGVKIEGVQKVESPNYLFINLTIAPETRAGKFMLEFRKTVQVKNGKKKAVDQIVKISQPYELKVRDKKPQEITSKDLIYQILPDRFANGDPSNDKFPDMADPLADRSNPFLRHGGDLQGIIQHLDYVQELGATALWLNPVLENNQFQTNEGGSMRSSYHGYHFTDLYNVDKRLGGNDTYKKLIDAAHEKGIKIIQDAIYNHIASNHWMMKDLPMKSWINQWDTYTNTTYRDEPLIDILHGSASDKKIMESGWFVPALPDLNNKNELVGNYLIQHALWTVEFFGIDGWRIDTYMYNDLEFMNRCNEALLQEYPDMFITGENSVSNIVSQAYLSRNNFNVPFKSNLPSANDFVLSNAISDALNNEFGWNKGFNRIYSTLASDMIYQDANRNMIFLDNHDIDRFYSVIKEDLSKFKMGLGFLLTTRGVPQIYYGTEILTKNFKDPSDAEVRKDFPGGWAGDKENKFLAAGRNAKENEAFDFVKTLANFRKGSSAITTGKLMQFTPESGIYVYFRYDNNQTIMVILNQNKDEKVVESSRFSERTTGFTRARNVITKTDLTDLKTIRVAGMSVTVLELQK